LKVSIPWGRLRPTMCYSCGSTLLGVAFYDKSYVADTTPGVINVQGNKCFENKMRELSRLTHSLMTKERAEHSTDGYETRYGNDIILDQVTGSHLLTSFVSRYFDCCASGVIETTSTGRLQNFLCHMKGGGEATVRVFCQSRTNPCS
jgi:hypothetical protein